jgi:outer membrane protein assembly factor BamB
MVSAAASFFELQALSFADGRVYAEDLAAIYGFNAALHPLWTYELDDDPSLFSAPGDGSLYVNDEDDTGNGSFPQCMEKVSGATGHQTARNCGPNDSIPPTAAGSTVVGSNTAKLFAFRASDFGVRWTRKLAVIQNSATTSFGGRVVAGGESGLVAFLELATGQQVCQRTLAGRSFTFVGPLRATFDPGSGGAYLFDSAHDALVKVTPWCTEAWHYGTGATLAEVAATSATVVGAAGTRVFALRP